MNGPHGKGSPLVKLERDLSVFGRLGLERQPVGVKFLYACPEGIPRLDGKLALCEMIVEAENGTVFYADRDNHECVGPLILGMVDVPGYRSGELGPLYEIFDEPRANAKVYEDLPTLYPGTCNATVFAPLDKLEFQPDVLVVTGSVRQMEIVLRAMSYTTGEHYRSESTTVMGCAWTLVQPYLTGKINFSVYGLTYGHIVRRVGKEGDLVVSIPWTCLPTVVENLNKMKWLLPAYEEGKRGPSYSQDVSWLRQEAVEGLGT